MENFQMIFVLVVKLRLDDIPFAIDVCVFIVIFIYIYTIYTMYI